MELQIKELNAAYRDWQPEAGVRRLTLNQIEADIANYTSLLDSEATEHRVHEFLASHSYFFNGLMRLYGVSPLYTKIKLGSNYEVDFAWLDSGSFGPEWNLVEIESPTRRLFTDGGQQSQWLTHAIQQVRDWHQWVVDFKSSAEAIMPKILYPMGHVFIGRRSELTPEIQAKLSRISYENRPFVRLHTLDHFIGCARSVMNLVDEAGGGDWPVPMKALGHAELAAGLPRIAKLFLEHSDPGDEFLLKMRMNQREHQELDD